MNKYNAFLDAALAARAPKLNYDQDPIPTPPLDGGTSWDGPPSDPIDDIRRSIEVLRETPEEQAARVRLCFKVAKAAGRLVEVKLRSTDPVAVSATRALVESLPMGFLVEEDGRWYVSEGFVAAACRIKGWVTFPAPRE